MEEEEGGGRQAPEEGRAGARGGISERGGEEGR